MKAHVRKTRKCAYNYYVQEQAKHWTNIDICNFIEAEIGVVVSEKALGDWRHKDGLSRGVIWDCGSIISFRAVEGGRVREINELFKRNGWLGDGA